MNCTNAQENMKAFANGKLSIDLANDFLEHVKTCPECKEELEFTFVCSSVLYQLDNDISFHGDYTKELKNQINKYETKIKRYRNKKRVLRVILPILLLLILFLSGYYEPNEEINTDYHYDYEVINK